MGFPVDVIDGLIRPIPFGLKVGSEEAGAEGFADGVFDVVGDVVTVED